MVQLTVGKNIPLYVDSSTPAAGEYKVVQGTPLVVNACDATTGWASSPMIAFYDGSAVINDADTITQDSGASATADKVWLVSGTWVGGNAQGYIFISGEYGSFVKDENIKVGGGVKAKCLRRNTTVIVNLENTIVQEGSGSLIIAIPAYCMVCVLWTGAAKDTTSPAQRFLRYQIYTTSMTVTSVMGETNHYEQWDTNIETISGAVWTQKSWDISGIADSSRNGITKVGIVLENGSASSRNAYIDNVSFYPGYGKFQVGYSERTATLSPPYLHAYTGTGAGHDESIPRAGTIKAILIQRTDGGGYRMTSAVTQGESFNVTGGSRSTTGVTAFGDGSFTLGTDVDVNELAGTYVAIVFFED